MPGLIVICGSGRSLWEDFSKLRPEPFDIMAINGAVYGLTRFKHLASLHADMIAHWRLARGVRNDCGVLSPAHPCTTHSDNFAPGVDRVHKDQTIRGGNSALFGLQIALLQLGYEQAALCGVCLDTRGHYYDPPGTYAAPGSIWPWEQAAVLLKGRVYGMSGVTKEIFSNG